MTDIKWKRSRKCTSGNCVEVAKVGDEYWIRDSKEPDAEPLRFTGEEWRAFELGVLDGQFRF